MGGAESSSSLLGVGGWGWHMGWEQSTKGWVLLFTSHSTLTDY